MRTLIGQWLMRAFPMMSTLAILLACEPQSNSGNARAIRDRSPELAARADSLRALDPTKEARAAIERGDLRYVGVCGYTCVPVGIDLNGPGATALDSSRWVEGTSDAPENDDAVRLNVTAAEYATTYNRVIELERVRRIRQAP
jgi:hypothetical protein